MQNLRHISVEELKLTLKEWKEPAFRANQIQEWLWKKHAASVEDMSNLPKALRQKLSEHYFIPKVKVDHSQFSNDGTIKNRLRLHDGQVIESVLIPTEKRMTACVSSQAGCSLNCKFCATGYLKKGRNVDFDEIVDEVTLINQQAIDHYGRPLTNIVYMGMGEPLLNYKNVLRSIDIITGAEGMGMSPRRITVSTSGIAKMIKKLGDDEVRFKLALSLHSGNDKVRSDMMPFNDTNNIQSLVEALNYFYQKTKNEITLEYILFKNLNDSIEAASELTKVYRQIPADLVNVIEYNAIDEADFAKSDAQTTQKFMNYLERNRVNARLRRSRGKDIDAACGQLADISRQPEL